MIRAALLAPVRSTDAAGTIAVGTALTLTTLGAGAMMVAAAAVSPLGLALTPVVVVPGAILRGYRLRVIASPADAAAPSFVRWGDLLRSGLRSYLLTGLYVLPWAVAVVGVLIAGGATAGELPTSLGGAAAAVALLVAAGVAGLGALAVAYTLPAAQATLAVEGRFRTACSPRRVGVVALRGRYAGRWLLAAAVLVAGAVGTVVLSLLVVGVIVPFYTKVVVASLLGAGTADALDGRPDPSPAATDPEPSDVRSPEVPPAVQVGRAVPFDGDSEADGVGPDRGSGDDGREGDGDDGREGDPPGESGGFVFGNEEDG